MNRLRKDHSGEPRMTTAKVGVLTCLGLVLATSSFWTDAASGIGRAGAADEQEEAMSIADERSLRWVPWELFSIPSGSETVVDPVAVSVNEGRLLVAATLRPEDPDHDGDRIVLSMSEDEGESWSAQTPLVQGRGPDRRLSARSMGVLKCGTILLATAEHRWLPGTVRQVSEQPLGVPRFKWTGFELESTATVWRSQDGGSSWKDSSIDTLGPFLALSTCGHFLELADGSVIVAIYGPASKEQMGAALCSVGLIRSRDGEESWEYAGMLAPADAEQTISYGPADLALLPDGRWLCLSQMDHRGRGEHAWSRIARSTSSDGGKTWSPMEQILVGPKPSIVALPDGTVLCGTSNTQESLLLVSHDGAASWVGTCALAGLPDYRQPRREGGATWLCPMDKETVLAVWYSPKLAKLEDDEKREPDFPRGRMKTRGGMKYAWAETKEVVGAFVRKKAAMWPPGLPSLLGAKPLSSPQVADRWVLGESFILEVPELATGGLTYESLNRLRGGDWIVLGARLAKGRDATGRIGAFEEQEGTEYILLRSSQLRTGWRVAGVLPFRSVKPVAGLGIMLRGTAESPSGRILMAYEQCEPGRNIGVVLYSDDGGKTWRSAAPLPTYHAGYVPLGCIQVRPDGSLLLYGYASSRLLVHKSTDDGESWHEASVAPSLPRELAQTEGMYYAEQGFTILPDGRWVHGIRLQFGCRYRTPRDWIRSLALIYSSDEGQTWTPPQYKLVGVESDLAVLPGGAFYVGCREAAHQGLFWLSYDWGQTWVFQNTIYDGPGQGHRSVGNGRPRSTGAQYGPPLLPIPSPRNSPLTLLELQTYVEREK